MEKILLQTMLLVSTLLRKISSRLVSTKTKRTCIVGNGVVGPLFDQEDTFHGA
jgi:hypothetical protein